MSMSKRDLRVWGNVFKDQGEQFGDAAIFKAIFEDMQSRKEDFKDDPELYEILTTMNVEDFGNVSFKDLDLADV